MNKKVQSCIVILFTIVSILIMIFSDKINNETNFIKSKILVINKKHINLEKQSDNKLKNKDTNNEDNTNKKIEVHKDTTTRSNITASAVTSEQYKKFKMEKMNEELVQDKEDFFSEGNVKENADKQINSSDSKKNSVKQTKGEDSAKPDNKAVNDKTDVSKEDVSVFKVSRSQINDSLTLSDKTKLLSRASKLSAIDYEKVRKYLQSGSDQDIKNTVKLLKERLSEKDYDKAKEVAQKIINMDVVEQWNKTLVWNGDLNQVGVLERVVTGYKDQS